MSVPLYPSLFLLLVIPIATPITIAMITNTVIPPTIHHLYLDQKSLRLNISMKLRPLANKYGIIWKLETGYLTKADIYVDLVNIDESNRYIKYQSYSSSEQTVSIPVGMYTSTEEVIKLIVEALANNAVPVTQVGNSIQFEQANIAIYQTNLTDFIGLDCTDTNINTMINLPRTYTATKLTLPVPTVLYGHLSTIPELVDNDPTNSVLTIQNVTNGQISVPINLQVNYENLYLILSSNVNYYPLKYNSTSELTVIK